MTTIATEKHAAIAAWNVRQTRKISILGASAQPIDATMKTGTDISTTGRRPYRSDRTPATISVSAVAIAYPATDRLTNA